MASDSSSSTTTSPDRIITSWLFSSFTESVAALVVGCPTSRAIWLVLERQFSSCSRARQLQLQRALQTIRKDALSMSDYLLHAKKLADALAATGEGFSEAALQQMLLGGLDSSYDAIVTTLTTRLDSMTMADFHAHLLAFEMRLESQNHQLQQQTTVNVAASSSSQPSPYRSPSYPRPNSGKSAGRFQRNNGANYRPPFIHPHGPCQLCGKRNHIVATCWKRFDQNFQPPPVAPSQPGYPPRFPAPAFHIRPSTDFTF
ncbi:hypothetical protein BVC80_285g105 [Macleaya cordata]|uniref:Retrotransposon gag domain-containing protein n=1 Tax=Macleaya cordata TaxID=56857 RepID=A0A200QSD8_MACCD|nr:hypothetical protein BVC80_285g105 [Macleaya cordata]